MVRIAAFFVILLSSQAFGSADQKVDQLVKAISESSDLEDVHSALNQLYNTSTSMTADLVIKIRAKAELQRLGIEAAHRIQTQTSGARHEEDLLTVHMAELGRPEKFKIQDIELMALFGGDRTKVAAAIFLREHFMGRSPDESFFPYRPRPNDRPQENWDRDMVRWGVEKIPHLLVRLSFSGAQRPGSELSVASQKAFKAINKILFEAANEDQIGPGCTMECANLRRFRQELAVKYLDGMAKLSEKWNSVRTPVPIIDEYGEIAEIENSRMDFDLNRKVRNCEGEMVAPVTSVRSTKWH